MVSFTQTQRQTALFEKTVFISCIVPVYNEADNIENFLKKLVNCLNQLTQHFEVIVIDDGSQDTTKEKVLSLPAEYHIKLLSFSRNFGKEMALTAGLDYCSGEVAILMDADFQHPIEIIPTFLQYWAEGYEMVYGVRHSRANESALKRGFARMFYWLMKKLTHIDLPANAGDFRLLDRKVIDILIRFQERARFMKGLYAWIGFKKIAIPFEVQKRLAGKTSWGFVRLVELAITAITSFSDIPLRVWGLIGFIVSLVSLVYAIFFLTTTLIYGVELPGFPSIIVAVMFLGGMQLLSIGILGEYIARIFAEVKRRPKYVIELKHGFEE